MNIEMILEKIPDYQTFLTVDEMDALARRRAEEHPGEAEVFTIGDSRKGHPILCTKMGKGKKNALCFACPHPNEPIGAMTVLTMAELFLQDKALLEETGFTWYFIHCIDPDGTRLNEGWFKGPFSLRHYAKNYYRPAGKDQVEWTFPIDYKGLRFDRPIPETKALMALIDKIKPAFTFSLHNASFGGVYWYSTDGNPALCERLEQAAARQNLPLQLGEPESPYSVKYSAGVHSMMSMKKHMDYLEEFGGSFDPSSIECGTCSADYINTVCDCLTLMAELPYFYDKRTGDTSTVEATRGALMLKSIGVSRQYHRFMKENYGKIKSLMSPDNPFFGLAAGDAEQDESVYDAREKWARQPEFDRPATVAEELDNLYLGHYYEWLIMGLLRRACLYELQKNHRAEAKNVLEETRAAVEQELDCRLDELEKNVHYEVIPIKKLVAVQLESALVAADYLNAM